METMLHLVGKSGEVPLATDLGRRNAVMVSHGACR